MDLQKRTVIAVVLSILIVIVYSSIASKYYPVDTKGVTQNIVEASGLTEPSPTPITRTPIAPTPTPIPSEYQQDQQEYARQRLQEPKRPSQIEYTPIIFEQDNVIFEFSSFGGNLVTLTLKEYEHKVESEALLGTEEWSELEFTPQIKKDAIVFRYGDEQREIIKEYKISAGGYYLELYLTYRNVTSSAANSYYSIYVQFQPSASSFDERFKDTSIMLDDANILRINNSRIKKGSSRKFNQPMKWIGLRDKYFAYILSSISSKIDGAEVSKDLQGNDLIKLNRSYRVLAPGQSFNDAFLYYCGPQKTDLLVQAGEGFEQIRNFGKLDVLVKFLLTALVKIHSVVKSWGIAILILTVVIYFCLYPLTLKQMRSMKKMQVLQPEMEALRRQYKDNPQKLNKEVMELYKKHNANPLGGCLPIIFQIPVFFSLFQALSRGIELKGAGFLWIKDLSEPDRFIPGALGGKDINLLPILMMVAMFLQQKMSMRNISAAQSEQQKMMLWIMPLLFGFIFYNMPSGLVLYWFTNSILMMVSQWKALK